MAVCVEKRNLVNPRLFVKIESYVADIIGAEHFEKLCNESEFLSMCDNLSDSKVIAMNSEVNPVELMIVENNIIIFKAEFKMKESPND